MLPTRQTIVKAPDEAQCRGHVAPLGQFVVTFAPLPPAEMRFIRTSSSLLPPRSALLSGSHPVMRSNKALTGVGHWEGGAAAAWRSL